MKKAFTLIEALVVVGIIAIISIVALPNFLSGSHQADVTATTNQIVASARDARSQATNQTDAAQWGIHFSNTTNTAPFYATFTGASYATGIVQNTYRLPATVSFVSSTLPVGCSADAVFSQISGKSTVTLCNNTPTNAIAIGLSSAAQSAVSSTIVITGSGGVNVQTGPSTIPWIQSISPVSGATGTLITITGTNFTATNNIINFAWGDATQVATSSNNGTIMHFAVPAWVSLNCPPYVQYCPAVILPVPPSAYNVSVTNAQGTSNTVTFTVTP